MLLFGILYVLVIKSPFFQSSDIAVASDPGMRYLCISSFEIPANRTTLRIWLILYISVSIYISLIYFCWHIVRLVIFPLVFDWISPAVASLPAKLRATFCPMLKYAVAATYVIYYTHPPMCSGHCHPPTDFSKSMHINPMVNFAFLSLFYRYHPVSVQQLYDSIKAAHRTF